MIDVIFDGKKITNGNIDVNIIDVLNGLGYKCHLNEDYKLIISDERVNEECILGNSTNDIQLTPNFNLREFACKHCGAVILEPELVKKLQALRDLIGKPIVITSGYRCPTHNKNVGGVSNSQHVYGKATDIVVDGITPTKVAEYAENVGFNGIGIYNTFTHVDIRADKAHWRG